MHNMDDEKMVLPVHVSLRNGVYQYVRRVPDDVAGAFGATRIQRSLKTRNPADARLHAAQIDIEIEQQFTAARLRTGIGVTTVVSEGWTWPEWEKFVDWFKASLIEADTLTRLPKLKGGQLPAELRKGPGIWLDDARMQGLIDLRKRLREMSVSEYGHERLSVVQTHARRLGVSVSSAMQNYDRLMGACLAAELEALEIVFAREGGQWIDHPHPDAVTGPWIKKPEPPPHIEIAVSPAAVADGRSGRNLADMIDEWIAERVRLKKKVDPHLVADMRKTVERFSALTGQSDIGLIERQHVIQFRDHLADHAGYKVSTINKKTGFVTTLLTLAFDKGWLGQAIGGGIFIDIPADEDRREPYSRDELAKIFAHPIFTMGKRFEQVKACGELQFWLPLISVCHGLISSEILQLGPDTVCKHPDADVWCFRVTTAGSRSIKSFARERYVPVRNEILEMGLLDLVEAARRTGNATIWPLMAQPGWTTSKGSNYFSDFWSRAQSPEFGVESKDTSLYSLRHSFKDALDKSHTPIEIKQVLLGHADPGTTGRYGTKRLPRPVDINALDRTINGLNWGFLQNIQKPKL